MKEDELNRSFKIGSGAKKPISETLVEMSGSVCREFVRQTRDIYSVDHWKEAVLHLFLLYTGSFVIKGEVKDTYTDNFFDIQYSH